MDLQEYMAKIEPKYSGYQELHVHSTGSYRDAVNTVEEIFDSAERLGRQAVAITDHGNFTRLFMALKERTKREKRALEKSLKEANVAETTIDDILNSIGQYDSIRNPNDEMSKWIGIYGECFVKAVKSSVQLVVGIEMYATDGPDDNKARHHLILYAVDWIGLQQMFKLCNLAQLNQYKGYPQVTFETLTRLIGPGTKGHGKVIATSACVGGHLSKILLRPQYIKQKIKSLQCKYDSLEHVEPESIAKLEKLLKERTDDLQRAKEEKNFAKKAAGKDFSSRIKKLEEKILQTEKSIAEAQSASFKTEEKRNTKITKLQDVLLTAQETLLSYQEQSTEYMKLAKTLPEKEQAVAELTSAIKTIKESIQSLKKKAEPQERILLSISALQDQLNGLTDVYSLAKDTAIKYNAIFGQGNYYIELQNHGIPEELYCAPLLQQISKETGIPMTVANDVHYATLKDKRKRDLASSLQWNTPVEETANRTGNDQLYFKSNEQMTALFPDVPEALNNTAIIASRCNVYYCKAMHLPEFDTGSCLTPKEYLEQAARENLHAKYPEYDSQSDEWKQTVENRLAYELKIIDQMGYNSYIAIVQDFIFYARKIGGNEAVGPGRGSAAGSIVCYLLGITDIDPIRYNLVFERFLNPDRVSMPDIDTDFATSIRDKVVSYVADKYAYKKPYDVEEIKGTVCNIMTEGTLGGRSAIRSIGRITGVPYEIVDKTAKMIPSKIGMTIAKALADNSDLKSLYDYDETAKKLIDDALLIEGLPDHTGVHAAGIIIADKPISEYAPMFWNESKNVWVIQYDMVSCESDLGLLKMDFLGLKNLDVIKTAKNFIRKNHQVEIDFKAVNQADDETVIQSIYAEGATNGIFQFESSGMKRTLVNFAPTTIDDIALLNAAYRPGPMQYIPDITNVKFGRERAKYIVPDMASILDATYGKPIFQEQIQQIFHQIAGFSLGQADIIRRAMSKKKLKELVKYKDSFVNGLKLRGATTKDIESFWEELLDFANYAFNKSHAVAYSIISYYTAYLKHYYPVEYITALLSYFPEKISLYIRDAKNIGISVLSPNINKSDISFSTTEDGNILFGLNSIKGVANSANLIVQDRKENGEYTGYKDFICRMVVNGVNKRAIESLILSGALDSLIKNRKRYVENLPDYLDSCRNALKKIKNRTDSTEDSVRLCEELKQEWISPAIPPMLNYTRAQALEKEKELMGYYATGHPLDEYSDILDVCSTNYIAALEEDEETTLAGQIKDFKLLSRKSDGKHMCKFMLEDLSGEIEIICFTQVYEKYQGLLSEGAIISVKGRADFEIDERNGETIVLGRQFIAQEIESLMQTEKMVISATITDYYDFIQAEIEKLPKGNVTVILNELICHEIRKTKYNIAVTPEFLQFLNEKQIAFSM